VVEETLDWAAGATRLHAVDPQGAAVSDAIVRVFGPEPVPMGPVDPRGERTVKLAPGAWQALASSPGGGVGVVSFPVPEQASDLIQVDVVVEAVDGALADLVLRVVDGDGQPVVGASVELDGASVGETGQGGVLKVAELRPASFRMAVRHPDHPPSVADLVLPPGVTDRIVPMAWALRPARVTVTNDAGVPVQADVQWRGPADMKPTATNAEGVASTLLRPGRWQALVAEGDLGPGRVDFEVDDTAVDVVLVLGRSQVEVSAQGIAITEQVLFDFDAATLRAEARPVLDQVVSALLAAGSVVRVEVQGHTDATGDPAYNLALSEARANAVRRALIERGVPAELLSARGYGPQRPVGDNATPEGRRQNRRVAFEVLERGVE
jgi:outer membrane protein OmpA-like peptidoglycan-associated protein